MSVSIRAEIVKIDQEMREILQKKWFLIYEARCIQRIIVYKYPISALGTLVLAEEQCFQ